MRSIVCNQWGPPSSLSFEEGSAPRPPGKGEVAIAVSACSVNFPDLLLIQVPIQLLLYLSLIHI